MNANRDYFVSIFPVFLLCLSLFVICAPSQISAQDKTAEKKPFGAEASPSSVEFTKTLINKDYSQ